ncbi:hydroxyacid dehydrogenase [Elioraea sp.]|uniref:hydroxyacid dehydrogenase n=1 Tax=Elioraea sp. TaxID=2185103 RepID=UPI0025BDAEAD|nr:hydroxyacid dehydrogenase [Elioraea sp.]
MPHVLLAGQLHKAGLSLLEARPDITFETLTPGSPEFPIRVKEADAVLLWLEPITEAVLAATPRLKVVARYGVGYDTVDIAACTRRGIPVAVANGSNDLSVAEHAMMLMLAVARRTVEYDAKVRSGQWRQGHMPPMHELAGRSVLVIGYGRIGTRVAKLCQAFGMKVFVHDPAFPTPRIAADGHVPAPDWKAVLPEMDVVTLHCPLHPGTRGMMNAEAFGRMKPTSWLINTARGGVVDEPALIEALKAKRIAAAGLDVLVVEPPTTDHPLFAMENVVLAPHNAATPDECLAKMAMRSAQNIIDCFDGKVDPGYLVNPEVLRKNA